MRFPAEMDILRRDDGRPFISDRFETGQEFDTGPLVFVNEVRTILARFISIIRNFSVIYRGREALRSKLSRTV